jgi:precorrin-2 dehydrogenase / sirohydrochlorin ferrochelatase
MGYMVNLSLDGRDVLVVGGGEVARRKVEDLLAAKAHVTVVAPQICAGIVALAAQADVRAHARPYRSSDIRECSVVIAATDDEDLNAEVARDCISRNILVNVVDRPALCTFTVPATVHRGNLTIAIATEGLSPAFSGILREELEGRYGPAYGSLVELFGDLRKKMIAAGWKGSEIREKFASLYRDGIIEQLSDESRLREFLASKLGAL